MNKVIKVYTIAEVASNNIPIIAKPRDSIIILVETKRVVENKSRALYMNIDDIISNNNPGIP